MERFGFFNSYIMILPVLLAFIQVALFIILGIYRINWGYFNFYHTVILLLVSLIFTISSLVFFQRFSSQGFLYHYLSGYLVLSYLLLINRITWYFYLNPESMRKKTGDTSVIIYGAGSVTMHLLHDLRAGDLIGRYHIASIIDNDPEKIGSRLGPYKIQDAKMINLIVEKKNIKEIWLTMPVSSTLIDDVFSKLNNISITYKVVPRKFTQNLPDIRSLRIEDLIQRPEIKLSQKPLEKVFLNKRIIVTGAAGSIGSEIARQIKNFQIQRLTLIDQNERGIYDLEREFSGEKKISCIIADIRDKKRMSDLIFSEKPHIIFHAAAYKHVPLMEKNYLEAINTNILGTYNLLTCIQDYIEKTSSFEIKLINISTDKAVSPENIMGLSKRIVELLVHNAAIDSKNKNNKKSLKTISVRFGNVLSSSGSVVPLFWEQIQKGGPLTVTHPAMERFFMTVPEAVNLVLHGMLESTDNSILALDMGKAVNIHQMAERLILLSGQIPHKDIKIEFTGIRPGEKLKEELFWTNNSVKTNNPYIFKSTHDLKKIHSLGIIRKILQAQRQQKSLLWWKTFLKQFV
jgi:FlaA1/EpsC-like NDP-sugar epimerase